MMENILWPGSTLFGWHLHLLFGVLLAVGLVLFLIWAAKTWDKKSLSTWASILVIVGILGTFLTATWSGRFWSDMMNHHTDDDNWQDEMLEHMKNDNL